MSKDYFTPPYQLQFTNIKLQPITKTKKKLNKKKNEMCFHPKYFSSNIFIIPDIYIKTTELQNETIELHCRFIE